MSKITVGAERLGSGSKNDIELKNYSRSTQNLSQTWKSSISAGTLVPFMSEIALPGDDWEIELNAIIRTLPTIGPLFGSYKVQLDVFQVPFRLYQKQLKMNSLNIGMEMHNVHLPLIKVRAKCDQTNANSQIEPSALLSHLGVRWPVNN